MPATQHDVCQLAVQTSNAKPTQEACNCGSGQQVVPCHVSQRMGQHTVVYTCAPAGSAAPTEPSTVFPRLATNRAWNTLARRH